ncbi:MAG: hypothetical protein ABI992_07060 [Chthoniobacterales bacterium]
MRHRTNFLIRYALPWAIFGVAFVLLGAFQIWPTVRGSTFGPVLPYHTTNSYLISLLKIRDGSERLQRALAALPADRPVAVLLPKDDERWIFVGYLIGYFAWPREVQIAPLTKLNAAHELHALDRDSLGGIFFAGFPPPPGFSPALSIGAGLTMVPKMVNAEPAP